MISRSIGTWEQATSEMARTAEMQSAEDTRRVMLILHPGPSLFWYAYKSIREESFGRKQAELEGGRHATSGIARLQRCSAADLVHDMQ